MAAEAFRVSRPRRPSPDGARGQRAAAQLRDHRLRGVPRRGRTHGPRPAGDPAAAARGGPPDPEAARSSPPARARPTAVLATHECIAAALYADLAELGLTGRHRRLGGLHLSRARHPQSRAGAHPFRRRPRRGGRGACRAADRLSRRHARRRRGAGVAADAASLHPARQPWPRAGAGSGRDPGAVARRRLHAGLDEGHPVDPVLDVGKTRPSAPACPRARARMARAASA